MSSRRVEVLGCDNCNYERRPEADGRQFHKFRNARSGQEILICSECVEEWVANDGKASV